LIDVDSSSNLPLNVGVKAIGALWKLDHLEQTITTMSNSLEHLVWLMRGKNKNHAEKMNVLGDLSRGKPNPIPISEDTPRQSIIYMKGVGEDEFYGVHKSLASQDRPPQPER